MRRTLWSPAPAGQDRTAVNLSRQTGAVHLGTRLHAGSTTLLWMRSGLPGIWPHHPQAVRDHVHTAQITQQLFCATCVRARCGDSETLTHAHHAAAARFSSQQTHAQAKANKFSNPNPKPLTIAASASQLRSAPAGHPAPQPLAGPGSTEGRRSWFRGRCRSPRGRRCRRSRQSRGQARLPLPVTEFRRSAAVSHDDVCISRQERRGFVFPVCFSRSEDAEQ